MADSDTRQARGYCQCCEIAAIRNGRCARCGKPVLDWDAEAALLPLRVAQVTHALLQASTQADSVPVTTTEVMVHDGESLTLRSTSSALARAMQLRMADRAALRGLWMPTNAAWKLRRALEDRLLAPVAARSPAPGEENRQMAEAPVSEVTSSVMAEPVRRALVAGGFAESRGSNDGGFVVELGDSGCPVMGCDTWPGRAVIAISLAGGTSAGLRAAAAALRAHGICHGAGVWTPPVTPGPHPFVAHLEVPVEG